MIGSRYQEEKSLILEAGCLALCGIRSAFTAIKRILLRLCHDSAVLYALIGQRGSLKCEIVYNMPDISELYARAVEIATKAHEGQTRWGGEPYITHPLAVADSFGMIPQKVIAVLHDVIEDTDVTEEELRKEFPNSHDWQRIVDALVLLTHRPGYSYADYIGDIRTSSWACWVKQEDIHHNLSDCYQDRKKHKQRIDKYELALKLLRMPWQGI